MTTPKVEDDFDDGSNSVVIGVIRDLTKRLETYERSSSNERAAFKRSIEANLVQVRKDFHNALSPLQLDNIDHRKTHENDRVERIERQSAYDGSMNVIRVALLIMGGLLVGVLVLLAIGIIVVIKAGR